MTRRYAAFLLLILSAGLVCGWGGAAAAQFLDINPVIGLPGAIGVAWGDYDDDGLPDLVLTSASAGHWPMLLHNDGGLWFTDVSSQFGLPSEQMEQDGAAWGDYDNDGDLDLLVGSGAGYPLLFRRDGSVFTEVGEAAGFHVEFSAGRSVNWCDYDGDNLLDAFCSNIFGRGYLMHNDGDGTFTEVAEASGLWPCDYGQSAAWGDYNNDGWPDLLLARMNLPTLLFRNDGDGAFTNVSIGSGVSSFLDGFSAIWGDYNNDGWLDCYLSSATGVRDWLLRNNHDGTFTDVSATAGMAADVSVGTGAAWSDYNNDGWLDLFVSNLETNNQAFLYENNGNGTFTDVTPTSGMAGSVPGMGAAWADFDGDGRPDLFQAVGGPLSRLFRNVGPAGNWLRVQALTSGSGDATGGDPVRDAIGARVEVSLDNDDTFPSGRTLTRLIDGGSGFLSQNEQIAHFGLGSSDPVAVRVRFPDGSVVVHRDVAANQQTVIRDVPAGREEIFDDVPLDYWAYPAIAAAVNADIVQGYWNDTYRPTAPVDRASMAVYIARALAGGDEAVPEPTVSTPSFPDVGEDHWAYKYIEYAASPEANVVQGYPSGEYRPDQVVNRGQMAVYVARAMVSPSGDAALPDLPTEATFPDVTAENEWSWCYPHVEYLADEGIVQGYPNGTYRPDQAVTRDQMAVYIARAFHLPM